MLRSFVLDTTRVLPLAEKVDKNRRSPTPFAGRLVTPILPRQQQSASRTVFAAARIPCRLLRREEGAQWVSVESRTAEAILLEQV
jgi:hypothetical protein